MAIATTPQPANANPAATTNQRGMTLARLETFKFVADIAAVTLAVLTAAAGVFALYFSSRVSAVKDAELLLFQNESNIKVSAAEARSAEANTKAAEANRIAESFRLDIAKANERAAEANAVAERERLA